MIFDLINNEPTITIEGIFIPEFRAIWEADKSKDKSKASQALSYVYNVADYSSNYSKLPEDERRKECANDYLIDDFDSEDMDRINEAIVKYFKLQETTSMRLLKAAKFAANKLSDYFYGIDFTEVDFNGKLKYNAKDLAINLEKVGKIISSLGDLDEIVAKEKASGRDIRRGVKPSVILD